MNGCKVKMEGGRILLMTRILRGRQLRHVLRLWRRSISDRDNRSIIVNEIASKMIIFRGTGDVRMP